MGACPYASLHFLSVGLLAFSPRPCLLDDNRGGPAERLRCRVQKGGCNPMRTASGRERAQPRPDRGGEKHMHSIVAASALSLLRSNALPVLVRFDDLGLLLVASVLVFLVVDLDCMPCEFRSISTPRCFVTHIRQTIDSLQLTHV